MKTRELKKVRSSIDPVDHRVTTRRKRVTGFRYRPRLIKKDDLLRGLCQQIYSAGSLNKLYASLLLKTIVGKDPALNRRVREICDQFEMCDPESLTF